MHALVSTRSVLARLGAAAVTSLVLLASACDGGGEGDRCNPNLSHDECGTGLSCQQPAYCPESYCCPTSGSSSNPFCQPGCNGGAAAICKADPTQTDACAVGGEGGDAGSEDGGGDGASDAAAD